MAHKHDCAACAACEGCGEHFASGELQKHRKSCRELVSCRFCHWRGHWQQHMAHKHDCAACAACEGCGEHFASGELQKHRQSCWHLASCPVCGGEIVMYHGTSECNAASIVQEGRFRPSAGGMLGQGVYLSKDPRKARHYGSAVLQCIVSVGRVVKINRQGHPLQKSWSEHGYDTAWVPPNCGMVPSGLEEDCVLDPGRIQILGVL